MKCLFFWVVKIKNNQQLQIQFSPHFLLFYFITAHLTDNREERFPLFLLFSNLIKNNGDILIKTLYTLKLVVVTVVCTSERDKDI
jgi:hypothetical protein